jgi:hypothetical protein
MRIPMVLIAEYAVAKSDGSFYIVGGGFDAVNVASFPHTMDRLSLAVRAAIESSDPPDPTVLTARFTDPQGAELFKPLQVTVTLRPEATLPATVNLVWNFAPVPIRIAGVYTVGVYFQGREVANAQFTARGQAGAGPRDSDYVTAFQAYAAGDVGKAEQLMRALAEREPTWSTSQNALGFILLARGEAREALAYLEESRRLGYAQSEVLNVNIACCHYLLGHRDIALTGFQECLHSQTLRTAAILAGLNDDSVFTIHVQTPQEYFALVALNATWSALPNNLGAAREYLQLARTLSDLAEREPGFTASLDAAARRAGTPKSETLDT